MTEPKEKLLDSSALGDLYKAAKSALFIFENTKLGDVGVAEKLRKAIAKAERRPHERHRP